MPWFQDDNGNATWRDEDSDRPTGPQYDDDHPEPRAATPAPMAGWYDDLWGSYNNFVDRRYDYRTDPSKLPKFDDFVGAQQKAHADHFGVPLNRPWNADVDIARAKTETIDSPFLAAVAEYNSLYGTDYQVDPAFLGANSRAGVNPYMDSQPMRNRNESGFFKQGPGRALLAAAAIAAGGWGLAGLAEGAAGAGLAEGTAAGLAGAGESIMAGGYGANLAASGAGFGAGATGLSLGELGAGSLLGGGAGSVLAGGAGALGLSAGTVAAMQALGYSGAEIASMGGNVLNGFDAMQAAASGGSLPIDIPNVPPGVPRPDSSFNPDASSTGPSSTTNPTGIPGAPLPLSTFDKFLNGILDNPIKSALSAGQILSGISTANKAMSPQQAQAMADPFSPYRQQYINQLNAVMANPALAMSQPGYQFQRQQGEQALDRKLAARGMGSYTPDGRGSASGGADIARMKYGQEYALGSYNDYVKQLAGLAGATQAPGIGGQAALSAQAAAAKAATEGWSAINQGVGTMQGIMKAAPSGNPNNSGWSTPATPGFQGAFPGGVPWSDMPAYSGNVPSNTATDTGNYYGGNYGEPTFPVQPVFDLGWGYT